MTDESELRSKQGNSSGQSVVRPTVFRPPDNHTSKVPDRWREEYLPNRKDPKGEEKVDELGVLKGRRRYACDTFQLSASKSRRLFFSAKSCATHLGYQDVKTMLQENPSLLLTSGRRGSGGEAGKIEVVSALSIFRQFGHRIIRRGRSVFDDYFEAIAKQQGFEDNTIWAAVNGDMPHSKAVQLLRQCSGVDFEALDHAERSPLDYMQDDLRDILKRGFVPPKNKHDDSSIPHVAWVQALTTSGTKAREAVNSAIDYSVGLELETQDYDKGHFDPILYRTLTSALSFCSHVLGTSLPLPAKRGAANSRVMVAEWDMPQFIEDLKKAGNQGSVHNTISTFVLVFGSGANYECSTCSEALFRRFGDPGRRAIKLIADVIEKVLAGDNEALVPISWLNNHEPSRPSVALELLGRLKLKNILGPGYVKSRRGVRSDHKTPLCAATRSTLVLFESAFSKFFRSREEYLSDPLFEAAAWLCAAFRPLTTSSEDQESAGGHMYISRTTRWHFSSSNVLARHDYTFLKLEPLQRVSAPGAPSNCWNKLFSSAPIVETTVDRSWGSGLQIPFDLMVRLAAIQNYCWIKGSVILLGFYTALVPTDCDPSSDSIQWHFECREPKNRIILSDDLLDFSVKDFDLDGIQDKRCFVGWHAEANIMLGTQRLVNGEPQMDWSRSLQPVKHVYEKSGFEVGAQVALEIGPLTSTLIASQQYTLSPYMVHFSPSDQYREALLSEEGNTCLLIDDKAKHAWLVPLLSVLLHMCHRFGQMQVSRGRRVNIPHAMESPTGDEAVIGAIMNCGDQNIFADGTFLADPTTSQLLFRQLFHGMLFRLRNVKLPVAEDSRIFAVELMDVVTKRTTSPKEIKTEGNNHSWTDLVPFTSLVDTVAVARDIGQVIQPLYKQECECSESCNELPAGRGYLAAHVSALRSLRGRGHSLFELDEAVSKGQIQFSPSAWWVPRHDPWMWAGYERPRCRGIWANAGLTQMILQKTCSNSEEAKLMLMRRKLVSVLKEIPRNGVVVFGRQGQLPPRWLSSLKAHLGA